MKDMYIFSKDFLLTLNLSVRSRFSRAQAFVVIVCICSDQVRVFESVSPRCLCVSVSVSMVLFMRNGGWRGRCSLRENIMDSVFFCIKTNQPCVCPSTNGIQVYVKMVGRPIWGMMYKLVSFANNLIEQPTFFTISFM